jgi:hypothetical protein
MGADPSEASVSYLRGRLALLEAQVRAAVAARRAADPQPDDRFRGLYIPESRVDELLADPVLTRKDWAPAPEVARQAEVSEAQAGAAEDAGADIRLRRLARTFGLSEADVAVLLVALAPDLDPRFEQLYGYLQDDVSRRRAGIGLALELAGGLWGSPEPGAARARFHPDGPLVGGGLLIIEDPERPFLTRALRVPDRVGAFLLGDDRLDPLLTSLVAPVVGAGAELRGPVERALRAGAALVYLRERPGAGGASLAAGALGAVGLRTLALDLCRLDPSADVADVAAVAAREAGLMGAGVVAGPVEVLAERSPAALRALAEARGRILLYGTRAWDPGWSRRVPAAFEAVPLSLEERAGLWRAALDGEAPAELAGLGAGAFRLTPEQVVRAAEAARYEAVGAGRPLRRGDVLSGARAQNAAGLERLARRIRPKVGWEDLVLPADVAGRLRELAVRARYREQVLDAWGMGARSSRGRGITALFAGDSGVGKTMSAEVVAWELGLDLYVIDLSSVVDKYIGETEKNLDRIFAEADRVNGVLLFDEADAIFGKRSEVRDAHDRYANVEVAYLLQRMETFDGLAILTTNLRSNLDEAFTRRLDAILDFPAPEAEDRLRLWRANLRPELPTRGELDLDFLARSFKLSGGNIRNIAVGAAYFAAGEDRPLEMADLVRAPSSAPTTS